MKILAIRGENLASLSGRFAVELHDGPLGRSGVFAITGPTGAGKSTLLDAMCLALYGETPRTEGKGGAIIPGADALASRDPRILLRRGAGSGFAEVEFQCREGKKHRVRWSVNRARNKADGKLQKPDHVLFDGADGKALTSNTTQTVDEVAKKLGLNFDQFKRSVLLAQGDFAAFLKADDRRRTELLEQMTGTDVYREVSRACYERSKAAKAELERFEAGTALVEPMSGEVRADYEQSRIAAENERIEAERSLAGLRAIEAWYAGLDEREAAVERTRIAAQGADAAWVSLADERARLERLAAVEQAGIPALDRTRRAAEAQFETARAEHQTAERLHAEATTRYTDAFDSAAQARIAWEKAENVYRAALPVIEAASARTADCERLDREADEQSREAGGLDAEHRDLDIRAAHETTAVAGIDEQSGRLTAWLDAHVHVGTLAGAWAQHEARLRAAIDAFTASATAERGLAGAVQDHAAAGQQRASAAVERDACAGALTGATETLEAIEPVDPATERLADETRAAADTVLRRVDRWRSLVAQWDENTLAHDAERAALAAIDHTRTALDARLATTAAALETQRVHLAKLTVVRDGLRAALGLHDHRARLRDGDACPLCGSIEHPFAHGGAPVQSALQEAEAMHAEAERALQSLVASQAGDTRERAQLDQQHTASTKRWQSAADRLASIERDWSGDAGAPPPPGERDPIARLDAMEREAFANRDHARTHLESLRERRTRIEAARAAQADRRTRLEAAERRLRDTDATMAATASKVAEARSLRDSRREAHVAIVAEIEVLLGEHDAVRVRIARGDASAVGELEWAVANFHTHVKQLEILRSERAAHTESINALDHRRRALDERRATLATLRARTEALRTDTRAQLTAWLGTESLGVFRTRHDAHVTLARENRRVADNTLAAATVDRDHAVARRTQGESSLAAATDALARARDAVGHALDAHGWSRDAIDELLAWTSADVHAVRTALHEADAARRSAHDAARAAAEALASHHARAPAIARDTLADAIGTAGRASDEATGRLAVIAERLDDDDARRAATLGHGPERARLQVLATRWSAMSGLIGSADGRSFAAYAQSLTLELLLAHANVHLAELCRRYRLEAVPGTLDFHVVDQDMGDERRAVTSLSGGESFLVSLALALALSSIASNRRPIGSLFIDEGFGTLDPATLDTALAALDALQATGRQVGLISHVSGLAERIGVQVRVVRTGTGSSRVEVTGA